MQQQLFYLSHGRNGDSISVTAAANTLYSEHYHGSSRHSVLSTIMDSITAAAGTPSRQQQALYHGGSRHSSTAAASILSRQQQAL